MKRLNSHLVGIDEGSIDLFSDFENGGEMWTGQGPRERRRTVLFSEPYRTAPSVHVAISMWDTDHKSNQRAEISATSINEDGFTAVFRTWGDSRVARIRVAWMAIGELHGEDDWEIY